MSWNLSSPIVNCIPAIDVCLLSPDYNRCICYCNPQTELILPMFMHEGRDIVSTKMDLCLGKTLPM